MLCLMDYFLLMDGMMVGCWKDGMMGVAFLP